VHDFDPGITPYPGGLFWTVPLTADALTVEFGAGRASMNVSNLALNDFFNIPNALFRFQDPVSMAAAVSFDIIWSGPITNSSSVDDPSKGFSGDFVLNQATMTWSASNALGLAFTSNPSGTTSAFAQLGHMQNGVFSGG
jgi:hypothetical protein